jgi:integrase
MKTIKPGIRLKPNGRYSVTKSIDGKRFYKEFKTQREAENWKNKFHPLAPPVLNAPIINRPTVSDQSNGKDKLITFREVLTRYKNGKMKNLSVTKQYKKEKRMDRFLPSLLSYKMCEIDPPVITRLLEEARRTVTSTHGRSNFNEELKDLRSVFNWYIEECDFTFHSPVTKYHPRIGVIKEIEKVRMHMTEDQIKLFFSHLKEPFQSMAIIQFCLALRIGEVAALNSKTVNFKLRTVTISDSIVWHKGIPRHQRKTKTGDSTVAEINDEMLWRLNDLDRKRPEGCIFFFNENGGPMRYEHILEAYNTALKDAVLTEFSGTHFVRHTMATLTRRKYGMDTAQAVLRHTTPRMSEIYAKNDVNEKVSKVVIEAQEMFKSRASNASNDKEKLKDSGT